MTVQKPREIAARILLRRADREEYTEALLERELAGVPLSAPDRGLCQELVYGVVRRQMTLDWLITRKTKGRPQKPLLQILLQLGLYQIFWLDRIPDHAAVHETVEQAKRAGFNTQAGFINAVLRGYLREADATKKLLAELKTTQPALGYSHPEWLVARWQKRWGAEKTAQLLEWNNTPPKTFGRVNTLKYSSPTTAAADLLVEKWRHEGVEAEFLTRDWLGEKLAFELKSHPPLTELESFSQGRFYIQDPSTLLAVRELDPQPGETVLDLCAAPGGKTTFIAQLINNQGRVVAQDILADRVKLIEENCTRLGVTCVEAVSIRQEISELVHPHPNPLPQEREQQSSGLGSSESHSESPVSDQARERRTVLPLPGGEGRGEGERSHNCSSLQFDRVLVDAPCSNTGVMRRRVDLRWRVQPDEITRLRATQLDLLRQAASALKPGGVLVYSTCSLEPEENSEVVKEFLAEQPDFKLESDRELLPFADGVDGAFVAKLRKVQS